jgi:hypothetical protein
LVEKSFLSPKIDGGGLAGDMVRVAGAPPGLAFTEGPLMAEGLKALALGLNSTALALNFKEVAEGGPRELPAFWTGGWMAGGARVFLFRLS